MQPLKGGFKNLSSSFCPHNYHLCIISFFYKFTTFLHSAECRNDNLYLQTGVCWDVIWVGLIFGFGFEVVLLFVFFEPEFFEEWDGGSGEEEAQGWDNGI